MFRKRVAAINDLSGLGKCSLAAALPILSTLGVEPCPIPTAVLTNQTGYDSFYMHDCTDLLPHYIEEWKKRNLHLDAIYTGFMSSEAQIDAVMTLIETFKTSDTLLLVDPVMADNGKIYGTYTEPLCKKMAELAALADVVTPNLTEACILANEPYAKYEQITEQADFEERIFALAEQIASTGPSCVVITGIPAVRGETHLLYNFAIDRKSGIRTCAENKAYKGGFSGTGDILASAVCGCLVQGIPIDKALLTTAAFLEKSVAFTAENGGGYNDGICYEPFLHHFHDALFR